MSCECCLSTVVGHVGSRQKGSTQGRAGRGRPGNTPPSVEAREVGGRTGGRKGGGEDSDSVEGAWGECLCSAPAAAGDDVEVARGEGLECSLGTADGDEVAGLGGRFLGGDGVVLDLAELEDLGPVGTELILGLTELLPSVDPSGDCFPFEMAAAAAATVAAMIRSAFLLVELEPFIMSDSILLHARVSRANGLLLASNGG